MSAKNRVDTIRVIAGQNQALKTSPKLSAILGEFNRIISAERYKKDYGWLLKVLHTTRALDTSLNVVIMHKAWNGATDPNSLGSYLKILANKGVLTPRQGKDFQRTIVKKRNKYMHQAGAMPDKLEADSILSEMQSCLVIVLSNT